MRGGLQQMTTCLAGRLLLVLLGLWVVLGLALPPGLAQDAVPTIVAGELVTTDPEAIYVDAESGGIFDVQPAYARRFCEVYDVRPCATHAFAFLGMPGLLPVAAVLGLAGPDLGVQAMRLLGALSAVAAMAVLWSRLAGRSRSAPWAVLTSAVVATPLVLFCIGMGQTSTVLWLSVVLGVGGVGVARARGAAGRALVWATAVLVKATPLALGAVLVWQRRWRMLGISLAVLVVLHLVAATLGGWRLLEWFGGSLGAVAGDAVGQADSSGYESVLAHLPGGGLSDEAAVRVAWALRIDWACSRSRASC